jgi:hypothetical protein
VLVFVEGSVQTAAAAAAATAAPTAVNSILNTTRQHAHFDISSAHHSIKPIIKPIIKSNQIKSNQIKSNQISSAHSITASNPNSEESKLVATGAGIQSRLMHVVPIIQLTSCDGM